MLSRGQTPGHGTSGTSGRWQSQCKECAAEVQAREAIHSQLAVEPQLGASRVAVEPENFSIPLQLDFVALRFKSRLQGASRQVKSRLDGAEAQQDALASRLDILESKWVNSLATSFMALFLALAAGSVLDSPLPGAVLSPFMVWAAVSRWVSSGDLTRACTNANWDLETAQAEGLADLDACRSQAMDDLAVSLPHESRRDSAGRRMQAARRDSTAKQQQFKSEVEVVQERMEQRLKILQSRLKQLRIRKDRLSMVWGVLSSLTLCGIISPLAAPLSPLDDTMTFWTPFLFVLFVMAWLFCQKSGEGS